MRVLQTRSVRTGLLLGQRNSQVYIKFSILFTTFLEVCSKNLLSRLDLFIAGESIAGYCKSICVQVLLPVVT